MGQSTICDKESKERRCVSFLVRTTSSAVVKSSTTFFSCASSPFFFGEDASPLFLWEPRRSFSRQHVGFKYMPLIWKEDLSEHRVAPCRTLDVTQPGMKASYATKTELHRQKRMRIQNLVPALPPIYPPTPVVAVAQSLRNTLRPKPSHDHPPHPTTYKVNSSDPKKRRKGHLTPSFRLRSYHFERKPACQIRKKISSRPSPPPAFP